MIEVMAMLLPVAAASGWFAARRAARKEAERLRRESVGAAYFRGLNYLVNEQPDKAIDVFVRMLEVNSETVELHLALGNLFRRRGEVDRAIRIHQNLVARPALSRSQRSQALLELGQDYLRAGLLDRAEGLFRELVDTDQQVKPALRNLVLVFQHEKEWGQCLEASRRLEELGDFSQGHDQVHYYCELAAEACDKGDHDTALVLLRQAEQADPANARSQLMQAELAMVKEDYPEAIRLLEAVEVRHPNYVAELIEPLATCHEQLGREDEWQVYLREQYAKHGSLPLMRAIADDLLNKQGAPAAVDFVSEHLSSRPSLRGLADLIDLRLAETGESSTEFMLLLKQLVDRLVGDMPAYQCHRCGFAARSLQWQCPGFRAWGTMVPFRERKEKVSS